MAMSGLGCKNPSVGVGEHFFSLMFNASGPRRQLFYLVGLCSRLTYLLEAGLQFLTNLVAGVLWTTDAILCAELTSQMYNIVLIL